MDTLSARQLALYVAFGSFSVLFLAALVAFFVTRAQATLFQAPDMPGLPGGLWLSTGLIVAMSSAFQGALVAARKNQSSTLLRRLWFGAALVVLFLLTQGQNWLHMQRAVAQASVRTLYPYTFYLLTGLHAAHVLGGLVPVTIVLWRATRREYSSSRHEGVALCAQYWHYLGIVWLVLFATLELSV